MKKEMYCNNIKVIVCDTYAELSETAAEIVAAEMKKKPEFVLGLATGSSPVGTRAVSLILKRFVLLTSTSIIR